MTSMNWIIGCAIIRLCSLVVMPALVAVPVILMACTPRVEVTAPDKPITINLNVKIDHEIRLKVDKDLEQVFSDQSGLF